MSEYIIEFDGSLCLACYGCNTACKSWRQVPLGLDWCRVEKKWKGKGYQARPIYVPVYCKQCVSSPCVAACPHGALSKEASTGIVKVDGAKCVSCKACFDACPYEVPQFPDKGPMQKCDVCSELLDLEKEEPPCVTTCPTKALTFKKGTSTDKYKQERDLRMFMNMPRFED